VDVRPAIGCLLLFASFASAQPKEWAKVGTVPDKLRTEWKLDPFYRKHADVCGLPILASAKVEDRALQVAADIVSNMLADRPDVRKKLVEGRVRVGIIGRDEQTTDMPEYSDLGDKEYWNKRARGLGATPNRPLSSVGEENLLGLPGDRYRGESILVHEFAHSIHTMGIARLDRNFNTELGTAFQAAKDASLWKDTYAMSNRGEYWAEGVQSYFDCNRSASPPNGVHNDVATRAKLKEYDPRLFKLIDAEMKGSKWSWNPPVAGKTVPAAPEKK
jgi:hypothetical protein